MMQRRFPGGRSVPLQEAAVVKIREMSSWLRDYITAIKHGHWHAFTMIERRTREATRNEPWGPTGALLAELAEASFRATDCEIIFAVLQLRLGYPPEKFLNCYKALVVLDHLLVRGSAQCEQICREELLFKLQDLQAFAAVSPEGKDVGVNVRVRAKALTELLADGERLAAERAKHARRRRPFPGFSRDQMAAARPFADDAQLPSPSSHSGGLRRTLSDSSMQEAKQAQFDNAGGHITAATLRNAGETKGVSLEQNERQLAALRSLLELPGNRDCADCCGGGAAARASWASISCGTFLCMRCAGVHRGLGTHVSKVRSCTLDTWLPEQVAFMAATGNAAANAFWEARLPPGAKPAYGSPGLDAFIRRKYTERAFAAEGQQWPPPAPHAELAAPLQPEAQQQLQQQQADLLDLEQQPSPPLQRTQPRLQGRRTLRAGAAAAASNSAPAAKQLGALLSVPLPPAASQPQQQQQQQQQQVDLLSLDGPEPPAQQQQQEQPQGLSLMDAGGTAGVSSGVAELLSLQPLPPPPSQPAAAPQQQQGALPPLPDAWQAQAWRDLPSQQQQQQQQQPELSFQGFESVSDWGAAAPASAAPAAAAAGSQAPLQQGARLARLHVPTASIGGASDASTPFLTPNFSALLGPGPFGSTPAPAPAPAAGRQPQRYQPPDVAGSLQAAAAAADGAPPSALTRSAQQWTAAAQQQQQQQQQSDRGVGVYEDLVLHAVASLQPPNSGGVGRALAAGQAPKPPAMRPQLSA